MEKKPGGGGIKAKAKACKKAQLAQHVSNFLHFHSIHIFEINNNKSNVQIHILFPCKILNSSSISPRMAMRLMNLPTPLYFFYFFKRWFLFWNYCLTFFLLVDIIFFPRNIFCLSFDAHMSTALYILRHLYTNQLYIFITKQLKIVEISTS